MNKALNTKKEHNSDIREDKLVVSTNRLLDVWETLLIALVNILSETSQPPLDIFNIYEIYMATIYTQYGKINKTEPVKISFS